MLLVNKPELAEPQHITTPISPFNSHFPGKFGAACSSSFFFLYMFYERISKGFIGTEYPSTILSPNQKRGEHKR